MIDSTLSNAGSVVAGVPTREQQNTVRDEVLSDRNLRSTLRHVGPPRNVPRVIADDFPSNSEVDFVRRHLTAAVEPTPDWRVARLSITLTGSDSQWTQSLLDRLIGQAVDEINRRAAQGESSASSPGAEQLAEAKQAEHAAQRELDGFLSRYFHALRQSNASQPDESPSRVPQINPLWRNLQEQLAAQLVQLEQILIDRTPEHPQAQDAMLKLEALQRQLDQTPKTLGDEDRQAASMPHRKRQTSQTIRPAQFAQESEYIIGCYMPIPGYDANQTFECLNAELRQARERRQELELTAAAPVPFSTTSSPVVRVKIVSDAHLVQTLREPASASRLVVLPLASMLAGACFALIIRFPRTTPVFTTTDEVKADLRLPIVGVVTPFNSELALCPSEREQER